MIRELASKIDRAQFQVELAEGTTDQMDPYGSPL